MGAFASQPWRRAAEIAESQWGVITAASLLRCGCSRRSIERAVATGRLFRLHHGVYALGRRPTTPHERAMAAVLAGGPGALLSHRWGLWLWDLGRLPQTPPDVLVPRSRTARPGLTFHRTTRPPEPDLTMGIPLTPPARTLADCAPTLAERQLRRAVNDAQIRRLTQRELLVAEPRLRALVSDHGATRSCLEDLLVDLHHTHGLPQPDLNAEVHGVEVDFYYRGRRTVVEADGYAFHRTKVAFEDDHERRLHLEAKGERVIAVDYRQVTRLREQTAHRLLAVLR